MVKASIWRPLVARSPLAASCTCCRSFWRSRISSSMVSVPTIERSDPSSTFSSIWRPLVARSPLAASCTCCRSFWRSRISSSMVSVPTIERSDPSSTFLTMESTCSGLASRNRSAALRSDSTSRPILNVATPCTCTLMPWLVTASPSCTLIWRAVSLSLPTRSSRGRTNVPPPTTTLTPLSPEIAMTWPRSSRTLAPREPATMRASFAPATLYRLATKAISRTRTITPVTARNGMDVTKLGIGSGSFFGRCGGCYYEVGSGDRNHLHLPARRDLGVGGGGHVVCRAGEADQNRAEMIGRYADRDPAGGADHVLQAEGLRRFRRAECLESPEHHA